MIDLWKRRYLPVVILLSALAGPTTAHEFWIAPENRDFLAGKTISAQIRVGQDFSGAAYPFTSKMIRTMRHATLDAEQQITAREGDRPAIKFNLDVPGLHRLVVETNPAYIIFDDLSEFSDYLSYEGLAQIADQHLERGLPETEIAEAYIRNAKTLVQVGPAEDGQTDDRTGLPLEIVALGSPFVPGTQTLEFELIWQDTLVAGAQISIFHLAVSDTAPGDTVRKTVLTDQDGRAKVDVSEPGAYLLNAVRMKPVNGPGSVKWESHWASVTFEITK